MSRRLLAAVVPLAVLACVAGGCGSSGSPKSSSTSTPSKSASALAAPLAPSKPTLAPPFTLHDQFGEPISLSDYRGKAVLLTFLYVNCPDVCPLIAAALRTTIDKLGPRAKDVQVIAISVDPVGDKPKAVRSYLSNRGVLHRFEYLVGTHKQLAPVWAKYHIVSEPDPKLKRLVGHTGIVIGIDAAGRERAYYPSSPLKPAWMVHDVPLLAKIE